MKKIIFTLGIFVSLFYFESKAQCVQPSASTYLDINNVKAGLLNGGDFWWDGVNLSQYIFPTDSSFAPSRIIFAGGIWLSALDANDSLKVAAMTYRNQGFDFFPGPIDAASQNITNNSCSVFNRFFEVKYNAIQTHLANTAYATPVAISDIPQSILEWPAKGNAHFTQYNIVDDLAPFVDVNQNGIYDPENGDYPKIKGDQAIFWVVNDIGGVHSRTGGSPLGVEVQFLAYAYKSDNTTLNNSTFYDVKTIKKTTGNLHDFKFGLFVDVELANYSDNYVGCDTALNIAFGYNPVTTYYGGGATVPFVATQFLNQKMSSFAHFVSSSTLQSDPSNANEVRHYMTGKWKDGTPTTLGGNGYGGTTPTPFLFYGNPADSTAWSEIGSNQTLGDRRYLQCSENPTLNYNEEYLLSFVVTPLQFNPSSYDGKPDTEGEIATIFTQLQSTYTDTLSHCNTYCMLHTDIDITAQNGLATIALSNISGGTAPYTVEWNNGQTGTNINQLVVGEYVAKITDAVGCSIRKKIVVDEHIAIDWVAEHQVEIYPNPVKNKLYIHWGNLNANKIQVFDINGKKVMDKNIEQQATSILNFKEKDAGIYILSISTKSTTYYYKIVR